MAEKYKGFAIKILAESPKWPGFSIIVNTKVLSKDKVQKIKDALVHLSPEDATNLLVGMYGFKEANDSDFDIVRSYERYR